MRVEVEVLEEGEGCLLPLFGGVIGCLFYDDSDEVRRHYPVVIEVGVVVFGFGRYE